MGERLSIVMVACLLVIGMLVGSCAMMKGADPTSEKIVETLIQLHFNAGEAKGKQVAVKKVREKHQDEDKKKPDANTFDRCTDASKCTMGRPVDAAGKDIIDPNNVTAEETIQLYFVSDAKSPGRTCVCYGSTCYCN